MITNLCKTPNGTVVSSYQYASDRRQETSGKWSYRVAITALNQAQEQFYRQFMPEERNNNER